MAANSLNKRLVLSITSNLKKPCSQLIKWKSDVHIVMTDDSSTIVCWHPEKKFPYEMTKPIPPEKAHSNDSVLKVQSNRQLLETFKPKTELEIAEHLRKLTYTTKHIWFPPKAQFRKKKRIDMDRPYL